MQSVEIENHEVLLEQIKALRSEKTARELQLKETFKTTFESINQLKTLKGYIQEIASDNQIKSNLITIGANIGIKFLLKKYFTPKPIEQPEEAPGYQYEHKQTLIQKEEPNFLTGIQHFLLRIAEKK